VSLAERLAQALEGGPLAGPLPPALARYAERRGGDAAALELSEAQLRGLARALATQPEVAGFLSHRPAWLERLAGLQPGGLAARAAQVAADSLALLAQDLEDALDGMRLHRREEMALAACAVFGGSEPFEAASEFLSQLAETLLERALGLAVREVRGGDGAGFAVLGMGKLAGRELTYHSDLDLIFLTRDAEQIDAGARIGQRLISYLTTMTGAGVAYEVDTRLRPSGRQGTLVTSYESFERYQTARAQTWEHLAVLRARAVAGDPAAGELLARVHTGVLARGEPPWQELAPLRQRVASERPAEASRVPLKTGAGGLMDVDFLAGGGLLERGAAALPALPSVPAMLRACAAGPRVDALLDDYRTLRVVEARSRWLAGRAVDSFDPAAAAPLAELVEPGLSADALVGRVDAARRRIRASFDAVVKAGTLDALDA
jgi:[glutamine synthetase] adenylyltransferase / [glutamine synthetase]-adenylyl-L-tyrosine phosphorylase